MTSSTKQCRSGQRCTPITYREAWHCQVLHSRMPADGIARHLDLSTKTLLNAVSPDGDASLLAPRHHELVLGLTPDNLAVVSYLARVQRAVVYQVTDNPADAKMATVVREFGELLTRYAKDSADRKWTRDEIAGLDRESGEAITAIVALVDDVKRQAEREAQS